MCQVLKCQLWVIMHFPCVCTCTPHCTTRSVLILTGSGWRAQLGLGRAAVLFCRPRFSRAMVWSSGTPQSMVATRFCCGSGKDAITDDCLCGPPDCPGLGRAQRAFQYPCMRPVGSFCTHGSFLEEKSSNEVHSLPAGCRWYSWHQDGTHSISFH